MAATKEDLVLGDIAVKSRLVTQEQLDKCLRAQKESSSWKSLGTFLLEKNYITPHQLQFLIEIQKRNLELKANQSRRIKQDNLLGRLLIRFGYVTEKEIEESLGAQLMINDTHFLRLGEIMIKKGFITEEKLKKVIEFQAQRQVFCPKCQQKYNLILFNDGTQIPCYSCNTMLKVPTTVR
jgi:hypothetical protein